MTTRSRHGGPAAASFGAFRRPRSHLGIATVQIPVTVPDGEGDCGQCVERLGAELAGQPDCSPSK